MNLEKRVEQLEARAGTDDDLLLLILSFVGCEPEVIGEGRAIEPRVTGYSAVGQERRWDAAPGESIEALRDRMEREIRAQGRKVYAVCECYH